MVTQLHLSELVWRSTRALTHEGSAGKRATKGKKLRVQGAVKSSNGFSGFLVYASKDNAEKRAHFHVRDVAEALQLKTGDEVAFNLGVNAKSSSTLSAYNVVRVKVSCSALAS